MTGSRPAFSICVYCGSRPGIDARYTAVAQEVGTWIGAHRGQLVYGGGKSGLMGTVADATLAAGGQVIGVIPRALVEREHANHRCTELHVVDTMHQRKQLMADRAEAFLALPGGIGTFEELFEAWTWRQLGYHDKPIGLLNPDGYYDALLEFLKKTVQQDFLSEWQLDLVTFGREAPSLLEDLVRQVKASGTASKPLAKGT